MEKNLQGPQGWGDGDDPMGTLGWWGQPCGYVGVKGVEKTLQGYWGHRGGGDIGVVGTTLWRCWGQGDGEIPMGTLGLG